jgi:hypothetical protein
LTSQFSRLASAVSTKAPLRVPAKTLTLFMVALPSEAIAVVLNKYPDEIKSSPVSIFYIRILLRTLEIIGILLRWSNNLEMRLPNGSGCSGYWLDQVDQVAAGILK